MANRFYYPRSPLLSRRTFVTGLAAMAGGTLLLGCGERGPGAVGAGPEPTEPGQDPVSLRWSMWSATQAERDVWEDLAADVTEQHPNIEVTFETVSFGDYWDRLQTQLAGGAEADILAMQSLRMPVFAVRNAMRPLNELIEQDPDFDYDDFFSVIQEGLSFRGDIYALAYDLGPIILFYNRDLFEAKGVPTPSPDEPMSWEEFHETAAALTDEAAGEYGFVMQPNFAGVVPWLWSGGGDYMDEAEAVCTLDADEALEALEFIVGMFTRDRLAPPITDLANPNWGSEQFHSGKVGMHTNGPWAFVNVRANSDFNWDIAPMPAGPAGSITWVAGSGFGISNTTAHPEEAWEALKVIVSAESHRKLAKAGRGYPARRSAVPAFEDPDLPPEHVGIVERILAGEIAETRFFRTTTTWQEIEVMLQQNFNPVFLGQQSVEQTIQRVKPKFDQLLEKHQELIANR